jgi:hypothetical protein
LRDWDASRRTAHDRLGVEERMSGDEVLNKAKAMGFECKSEDLKAFVKDYFDKRNP